MKIVVITSAHRLTDVRVYRKEAIQLAAEGHEVVLVGWREAPTAREKEGRSRPGSIRFRVIDAPRSRLDRMTRTVYRVVSAALDEDGDVYHLHDPELLPAGVLLTRQGKCVVFDAHESLRSTILTKSWIPSYFRPLLSRLISHVEAYLTARVSGVIAATPAIAKESRNRNTAIVQNFPRIDELMEQSAVRYEDRQNVVAFVGGISRVRGALEMVKAVGIVAERFPIRFILAGHAQERSLVEELESLPGWQHTESLGWRSHVEVPGLLGTARAGLVLFHPAPNHVEAQPNKLFEYMSAGLPVIASNFSLWQDIVGSANCGLLVDPLDPQQIANAIEWIFENPEEANRMGSRGREAVLSKYNWESESKKLISFYRLLGERGIRPGDRPPWILETIKDG